MCDAMILPNETKFDKAGFQDPALRCAPIYSWVWNYICTKERIDAQLDEMQRLGIRAFYIIPEPKEFRPDAMPTELYPDYLTREFFESVAYALNSGRERGMYTWIYDEGGWPSGGACGQVLKAHPEYARRVLSAQNVSFAAGEQYKKSSSDILAAFVDGAQMVDEGHVFEGDSVVTEYFIVMQNGGGSDYPDLLNRDSTDYFINITHDGYASVLSDMFGKSVMAVFTDEPKAPMNAFNTELAEKYENIYGESIFPYLPLLYGTVDANEENVEVLYRWYNLCSRVFCENFLIPCKNWANEHGIAFTGHFDKDHDALGCMRGGENFHLMRALRCMDIPGVDVICRQIYPESMIEVRDENNGCNGFFPRYASSAARQNGGELALTESMGVMGPGVTYEDMRYVFGYQAVRGVNIFNFMNISMGRHGGYLAQELPAYTEDQIYYRDLPQFNKYLERLSYISSLGDRVCDTALYYPMRDIWGRVNADAAAGEFESLGRALEDKLVDFDIIDDDVIFAAEGIDEGRMTMGKATYRSVVIPHNVNLPDRAVELLGRFKAAGGRVLYSIDGIDGALDICDNADGLRACRRAIDGGEIILLFREGGDKGVYRIKLSRDEICELSLDDGSVNGLVLPDGILTVELAVGESKVFMISDEKYPVADTNCELLEFQINTHFTLKAERRLACGDNGFYDIVYSSDGAPVKLGSWDCAVGSDYSGSCVYQTEFKLPTEYIGKSGFIDFGRVYYSARVELNGEMIGSALMPPYRLRLPIGLLREQNSLKITVTNTSANWYASTDYFDRFEISQLSTYFEIEREYANDYVKGGLCGPVKLILEK